MPGTPDPEGGPGDEDPARDSDAMRAEVLAGLRRNPKELSPKWFYDRRGSELFEEITRLDEYYLTRTERGLLERWVPRWVGRQRPASLVELGAGSARKTRILLDAMTEEGSGELFVPLDVSDDFLKETARKIRSEYPGLEVSPEVADFTAPLDLSAPLSRPALFALLGSTLGNFLPAAAVRLLTRIREAMEPPDRFLLGVDLRPGPDKPVARLERAYDDARGITAEFNLNILRVLNRELGADFDLDGYRHRALYDEKKGWIEMHLVSRRAQVVRIPGAEEPVRLAEGESIRTEISTKYDRATVEGLFEPAGLVVEEWRPDGEGLFALVLGRADAA